MIVSEQEPVNELTQAGRAPSPLCNELTPCETQGPPVNVSGKQPAKQYLSTEDQLKAPLSQRRSSRRSSTFTRQESTTRTCNFTEPSTIESQQEVTGQSPVDLEVRHEARYARLERRTAYIEAALFRLIATLDEHGSQEGLMDGSMVSRSVQR